MCPANSYYKFVRANILRSYFYYCSMGYSDLTKRQSITLDFIREFLAKHNYAPSYRDIMKGTGIKSPATAYNHVQSLRDKGYLSLTDGQMRSVELTEKSNMFTRGIELPLVGSIAAGEPIEAIENNESISVPLELLPNLNCYVLQVKGESMIEDGILDGDFVIVERSFYPENGDTVVALLDNENATLKRYYREKTRIRLQPANKTMKPIYTRNPVIQGIVRGVLRRY